MRVYRVILTGDKDTVIEVVAADVELNECGGAIFWNFTVGPTDEMNPITVAAFAFERVDYITSKER